MGRFVVATILLCVLLGACRTPGPKPPLKIDGVAIDRRQYPGSLLRGPEASAVTLWTGAHCEAMNDPSTDWTDQ